MQPQSKRARCADRGDQADRERIRGARCQQCRRDLQLREPGLCDLHAAARVVAARMSAALARGARGRERARRGLWKRVFPAPAGRVWRRKRDRRRPDPRPYRGRAKTLSRSSLRMCQCRRASVRRWRVRHRDPIHMPVLRARSGPARRRSPAEMWRVVAPGGIVLSYDMRPPPAPVRAMRRLGEWRAGVGARTDGAATPTIAISSDELARLFPHGVLRYSSAGLAFGLCTVAARSPLALQLLARIPSLREHGIGLVSKQHADAL